MNSSVYDLPQGRITGERQEGKRISERNLTSDTASEAFALGIIFGAPTAPLGFLMVTHRVWANPKFRRKVESSNTNLNS